MRLSRAASHTAFLHDAGAGRQHPRWHPRREKLGSCGQTITDACWMLVEGADDNEAGCYAPEECKWGALWGPDTWPHNNLESLLEGKQGVLSGAKDGKKGKGSFPGLDSAECLGPQRGAGSQWVLGIGLVYRREHCPGSPGTCPSSSAAPTSCVCPQAGFSALAGPPLAPAYMRQFDVNWQGTCTAPVSVTQ